MPAMRRAPRNTRGIALAALALALCTARAGSAEEWHEVYRQGVGAQARGDHARAIERFRRAIALHPEPGRNVVTYGTNVEPQYYPYLRLAEAYLELGQLDAARDTLQSSAAWKREPADRRQALQARLDTLSAPKAAATTAAATTAPAATAPTSATPAPTPSPTLEATAAATAPPATGTRVVAPPARATAAAPLTEAPRPAGAESLTGTVEIVTEPAGAHVYIDDEPVGSTDPATGRLVKSGLRPGRHRVRVSADGREDMRRDIDLTEGGTASLYATLAATAAPATPGPARDDLILFGVVAAALAAVVAWMLVRRPKADASDRDPTPRPSGGRSPGGAGTPPGNLNPGAHRDEHGQEWFGEFRLFEMLGRGGMASVYRAERRGEACALKRPLGSYLDDPGFLERFLREAEIGRALNHPSIVRIVERGNVGDVPYFTMELLPGQTLQAFLRAWGAAEPRTAASLVAQVGEALDFAHNKGVVHRDLKPSNIMVLLEGTAKVMDFGIARARRFEGLTTTGTFLGTPEYVAPEIVEGHGADPRSDLYALGIIFYELLTGQRPFTGDSPFAVLRKHTAETPLPPSRLQPGVPPAFDDLVARLLAKSPGERPPTAEHLVLELRDWLNRAS